jgi:hypothetical protein
MRRVAWIMGMILTSAFAVSAKEVKFGDVAITLTAPEGHCELDEKHAADARALTGTGNLLRAGGNQLHAAYAPCGQLAEWRIGKRPVLDDFAQYQSPIAMLDKPWYAGPGDGIKELCALYRQQGEKVLAGILPDVQSRVEATMRRMRLGEASFLGVLAEEPAVCYAAILQKITTDFGTEKTQVSLYGTTVVRARMLYYYLYARFVNADTVADMLTQHKKNLAALLAANGK